ncbi:MAG: preprotein translocase subunit SecG [Bauldia sp.]|uniref:preprotein translocase subunit SecG n=1 Tax=Bauldia sp. TaxID=2575872 RepID=UPI001D658E6C|nr:preprotein translocase subunit SecG [Bauldia sp.]MCB1495699.1 preprotein translocase subunit SecG [Bauldia sp.]
MDIVIIVIHLMVILALIAVVLLQRSEGGALGIGGGGNFMSTRGQTNVLTRTTAILAAAFFATSIALTILSRFQGGPASILDNVQSEPAPISADTPADAAGGDGASGGGDATNGPGILDELQAITPVPTGEDTAPATEPAGPQVPTD